MESDFSRFKKLKDICEVEISQELTPTEKKAAYLQQVGSSTKHQVDDVEVECIYGNMDINKMLADLVCG